jgi:hypothetical protein
VIDHRLEVGRIASTRGLSVHDRENRDSVRVGEEHQRDFTGVHELESVIDLLPEWIGVAGIQRGLERRNGASGSRDRIQDIAEPLLLECHDFGESGAGSLGGVANDFDHLLLSLEAHNQECRAQQQGHRPEDRR